MSSAIIFRLCALIKYRRTGYLAVCFMLTNNKNNNNMTNSLISALLMIGRRTNTADFTKPWSNLASIRISLFVIFLIKRSI